MSDMNVMVNPNLIVGIAGLVSLVPMIILFRYFILYRAVDFLVGSIIFLGMIVSTLPQWSSTLLTMITIPFPNFGSVLFTLYFAQVFTFGFLAINALLTKTDFQGRWQEKVLFALNIMAMVGLTGMYTYYLITSPNGDGFWYIGYRALHLYGTVVGLVIVYYYVFLDVVIPNRGMVSIIRLFMISVGLSRFFYSLFEVLWSISRGLPRGIGEQWAIFPQIEYISYNITPIPGYLTVILTLLLILLYPQFFVITQTQILRAKNLYSSIGENKREQDDTLSKTRITSYLQSIPQEFLEEHKIKLAIPAK